MLLLVVLVVTRDEMGMGDGNVMRWDVQFVSCVWREML